MLVAYNVVKPRSKERALAVIRLSVISSKTYFVFVFNRAFAAILRVYVAIQRVHAAILRVYVAILRVYVAAQRLHMLILQVYVAVQHGNAAM